MSVYFTSDLHLGHAKVAEIRGFASVSDHDRAISESWRARVRDRDQVWVIGDLAASSPRHALEILAGLPGEKHLILGNHDPAHPMHRDAHRKLRLYAEVFASVAQSARRRIGGREVLLSHFPYENDRGEPRYTQWRLRDEGVPLLHGHTHSTEPFGRSERGTLEIHVGVDAWGFAPVDMTVVEYALRSQEEAS